MSLNPCIYRTCRVGLQQRTFNSQAVTLALSNQLEVQSMQGLAVRYICNFEVQNQIKSWIAVK